MLAKEMMRLTHEDCDPNQGQPVGIVNLNTGYPNNRWNNYRNRIHDHVTSNHWQEVSNPHEVNSAEEPLSEL